MKLANNADHGRLAVKRYVVLKPMSVAIRSSATLMCLFFMSIELTGVWI